MSLIRLIRKYLFISILVVFVLGCASHFIIFRYFIHYSNDRTLREQKARIENYVAVNDTLPLAPTLVLKPARIEVREIDRSQLMTRDMFRDSVMYSEETGTFTPYRQLLFTVSYDDKHRLVMLNQPSIVYDDLFYAIIASLLALLVLFVLFTYVIGQLLKKGIWKPLDHNLRKLQEYDLKANTQLELKNPGVLEFDQLNDMIRRMVDKINADYDNSRLFTEDASHEMQTPLSIIKSKLDMLVQNQAVISDSGNEEALQAISRAVSRLSRLNKSLLLITRINNNQYSGKTIVRLDKKLETYLADLDELLSAKELSVRADTCRCELCINPDLSEILLSNLLGNAVRHNIPGGWIQITLTDCILTINNSCPADNAKNDNLFNRMTYHNKTEESLGLGLNIVKSICDNSGFGIRYDYPQDDEFLIAVVFKK